jgi:C4-dicarboxylate-specific signal transduction histidine kinase
MSRLLIIAEDPDSAGDVRRLIEDSGLIDEVVVHADPARDVSAHHNLHRLAQVGTLAAGAAHEINNLLTYLSITLSQAIRRAEGRAPTSTEDMAGNFKSALEVCERIQSIVRGITGFARSSSENQTLLRHRGRDRRGGAAGRVEPRGPRRAGARVGRRPAAPARNRVQLVQVFST